MEVFTSFLTEANWAASSLRILAQERQRERKGGGRANGEIKGRNVNQELPCTGKGEQMFEINEGPLLVSPPPPMCKVPGPIPSVAGHPPVRASRRWPPLFLHSLHSTMRRSRVRCRNKSLSGPQTTIMSPTYRKCFLSQTVSQSGSLPICQ